MKTATTTPQRVRRKTVPLRVTQVPLPGTGAELPGQGQRLFQLFRSDLMRAFATPRKAGEPHA